MTAEHTVAGSELTDLEPARNHAGERHGHGTELLVGVCAGRSMIPAIRPLQRVLLRSSDVPPTIGDVVVFTEPAGRVLMHRVTDVDGEQIGTRGDNSPYTEHWNVPERLIGIVLGRMTPNGLLPIGPPPGPFRRLVVRWRERVRRLPPLRALVRLLRRCSRLPGDRP